MWENISLLSYLLDVTRTGTIQLYKSLSDLTTSRNKKINYLYRKSQEVLLGIIRRKKFCNKKW
jgi:hypothetical protein